MKPFVNQPGRRMPRQKRGESEQVVGTPDDFLQAVRKRFGPLGVDLAATEENTVAPYFITPEQDSLKVDWRGSMTAALLSPRIGNAWLNPEFANIAPWAEKCARNRFAVHTLMLVPASVGSNWFRDYVDGIARVHFLNGRLRFKGHSQPYPKDCMLCEYARPPEYSVWNWRKDLEAGA